MKWLNEWKQFLIEQDFSQKIVQRARSLPEGVYVAIETQSETDFVVYYALNKENTIASSDYVFEPAMEPYGYVQCSNAQSRYAGPCLGGWETAYTNADKGWGPLLYEVAMEHASQIGGGLVSDRGTVSSDAYNVWATYAAKRSDVDKQQLDNLEDPQTPPEIDDCYQKEAEKYGKGDWQSSPLSKIYRKNLVIIPMLRKMGKLLVAE